MNTFKKKSLYAALAGVSALGATGAAQAVRSTPTASARRSSTRTTRFATRSCRVAPFTSLLSVVNSTASAKAVKVRFLEGKNSREVLDFNLYLSPQGRVGRGDHPDATGGAASTRRTCPARRLKSRAIPNPTRSSTSRTRARLCRPSLDRTREGYVEIIEMGDIDPGPTRKRWSRTSTAFRLATTSTARKITVPGPGGLFGNMTLINVLAGEDYGTEATALEGFSSTALWFAPGFGRAAADPGQPEVSVVTTGTNTFVTDWSLTPDVVSGVARPDAQPRLQRVHRRDGHRLGHDWVVTMPTSVSTSTRRHDPE